MGFFNFGFRLFTFDLFIRFAILKTQMSVGFDT